MKKYATKPDQDTLDMVVVMKVYWGDPREKLCEAVDNIPLDYLVIGNRGLGKAIMGSVSNYVVNQSSCPVTVLKHGSA
ncbi:putative rossmann-like alpha/beta/alpha sandwich protein [Helianthus annuus]|nr:putative rossmann-like alpha/beta/alpha sandwich protein [Helianthus annuus]